MNTIYFPIAVQVHSRVKGIHHWKWRELGEYLEWQRQHRRRQVNPHIITTYSSSFNPDIMLFLREEKVAVLRITQQSQPRAFLLHTQVICDNLRTLSYTEYKADLELITYT